MKREKLLKAIRGVGAIFIRHGGKHDIYKNPHTNELVPIPRHPDIHEYTAKFIIDELSKI